MICFSDGVLAELAAQTGEASKERLLEIARAAYFRCQDFLHCVFTKNFYYALRCEDFAFIYAVTLYSYSHINGSVPEENSRTKL